MSKTQILFIHGGGTFKSRKDFFNYISKVKVSLDSTAKWHGLYFDKKLGSKFEILRPTMPMKDDARYEEWKVYFEKLFPYLRSNIILIGRSLGAIFLAKYLSENKFPKKILATYLIAPPFDDTLPEEDLCGGFKLKSDLSLLEKNSPKLYLMFSENDNVVPISHADKFRKKLKKVNIIIYPDKNGNFKVSEFPEIVKMIKNNIKIL